MLGTVSLVVGLGTAAFTAGGGSDAAPGPRITPPVEMYSVEHAITTGEVPFPGPTAQPSSSGRAIRAHRHREARVFTPVTRSARHHGRDGRSPLLLAAALAVAVPGFLVSACSGQAGSGPVQNVPGRTRRRRWGDGGRPGRDRGQGAVAARQPAAAGRSG